MVFNRANGTIYRGTLECELGKGFPTTFQAAHGLGLLSIVDGWRLSFFCFQCMAERGLRRRQM